MLIIELRRLRVEICGAGGWRASPLEGGELRRWRVESFAA
jgi:hypothetical protein